MSRVTDSSNRSQGRRLDRVRDWRGWRQSDTVLRLIEMRIADGQHRLLLPAVR